MSAFSLINEARKYGSPSNLITDRWPAYTEAIATLLSSANHVPVKPMSSDTNNNLIESFNKTFKYWYKAKKGFNSFEKSNLYNFQRASNSMKNQAIFSYQINRFISRIFYKIFYEL